MNRLWILFALVAVTLVACTGGADSTPSDDELERIAVADIMQAANTYGVKLMDVRVNTIKGTADGTIVVNLTIREAPRYGRPEGAYQATAYIEHKWVVDKWCFAGQRC